MEKFISLAQVEQLIDEMEKSSDIHGIWKIFKDFKSKLPSLPTEESGWINSRTPTEKEQEVNDDYFLTIEDWEHVIQPFYDWCWEDWTTNKTWMPLPKPPLQ